MEQPIWNFEQEPWDGPHDETSVNLRAHFDRIPDKKIQQYRPAQRVPTDDPRSVLNNWKFDLRFFVYADQVHLTTARIYQGQVTNFASPLGGFTRVIFQ